MKYSTCLRYIIVVLTLSFTSCDKDHVDFSKRAKIALRDAGNKLLLSQNDSTSLIMPVKELQSGKFQMAFNSALKIEPDTLVGLISKSLKTSHLPNHYIVEVIQCEDEEVAYSYQMSAVSENTIIPCASRYLPKGCYVIEVSFMNGTGLGNKSYLWIGFLIILSLISIGVIRYKKGSKEKFKQAPINYEAIGSFKFYPEQNKLIKEAEEIALSKKECELLALFVERPNEVIKRDELTKKVWEDNGVFVGRSLDTYISKLRKKLKSDTTIKLTNVHGVGYKLEIL